MISQSLLNQRSSSELCDNPRPYKRLPGVDLPTFTELRKIISLIVTLIARLVPCDSLKSRQMLTFHVFGLIAALLTGHFAPRRAILLPHQRNSRQCGEKSSVIFIITSYIQLLLQSRPHLNNLPCPIFLTQIHTQRGYLRRDIPIPHSTQCLILAKSK